MAAWLPVGPYRRRGKEALYLPAHLQPSIGEVVKINILASKLLGESTAVQDRLLAIVRQRKLLANTPVVPGAEDIAQAICLDGDGTMQVLRSCSSDGELLVEAHHKVRKEEVSSFHIAYAGKSKLLI